MGIGIIYNAKTKILELVERNLRLTTNKDGTSTTTDSPLILDTDKDIVPDTKEYIRYEIIYHESEEPFDFNENYICNSLYGTKYICNNSNYVAFVNGPELEGEPSIIAWECYIDAPFGGTITSGSSVSSIYRQTLIAFNNTDGTNDNYPIICQRFYVNGMFTEWIQLAMVNRGSGSGYTPTSTA